FALSGPSPGKNGVNIVLCPRRTLLDKILVDAAVEAGVEVRTEFSVQEIVFADGGGRGIRGRGTQGKVVTENTRIVAGADGLHSIVARAVGAPEYKARPALGCAYYTYWSGVPHDGITVYPRDGQAAGIAPTNDGLTMIIAGGPVRDFQEFRAD